MTTVIISNNTTGSYIGDFAGEEDTWIQFTTKVASTTTFYAGGSASSNYANPLLRFTGLSNLPSSAVVSAVDMGVYRTASNSPSMSTILRRMLLAWTAAGANWTTYDGTNAWTTAGALSDGNDRAATDSASVAIGNGAQFYIYSDTGGVLSTDVQGFIQGTLTNNGHGIYTPSTTDTSWRELSSGGGTDGQRPFLQVTYTAGGTSLTVNSLSQAQTLSSATLIQHGNITPNGLTQTQTLDVAALTQHNSLAPANSSQAQTIDPNSLLIGTILNPNGLSQTQTLDAASPLIQHNALSPNALTQSQTLGAITLVVTGQLAVADVSQTQTLTLPTLSAIYAIAPANSSQAQTLDNGTLTGHYSLALASLAQAQTLDAAALIQHNVLVVDSLTQKAILDGVYFNAAVGWLRGTLVIVASLDGAVTLSPMLDGSITIN